jgi:ComF family protein
MNVWGVTGDYLVPIPLHRRKLRERGYNQAELIASGMSEVTGIPVRTDLVRRKKFTQTQTMLSLEERKKNMDDAFEEVPVAIRNLENNTCILVDDVITTGSTIISCARELRAAGASRTIAASSALAE